MNRTAKVFLALGYSVTVFGMGVLIGSRQTTDVMNLHRWETKDFCQERKNVLSPLEQSDWTVAQHQALQSICNEPAVHYQQNPIADPMIWLISAIPGLLIYACSNFRWRKPQ